MGAVRARGRGACDRCLRSAAAAVLAVPEVNPQVITQDAVNLANPVGTPCSWHSCCRRFSAPPA